MDHSVALKWRMLLPDSWRFKVLKNALISYSSKDQAYGEKLEQFLRDHKIDVKKIVDGEPSDSMYEMKSWEPREHPFFVIVCSESSIVEYWTLSQIDMAFDMEDMFRSYSEMPNNRILFPIAIDDALYQWSDPRVERLLPSVAANLRFYSDEDKDEAITQTFHELLKHVENS